MGWNHELLCIFSLVTEILPKFSCMVFCPSKKNTQVIANHISIAIMNL